MGKKLRKPLSTMRYGESWSAEREEAVQTAQGDVGSIIHRAVFGRSFMDFASGVSLRVVGIEWPARSSEGFLTLASASGERSRRRCVYDAISHNIRMYPA